MHYIIGIGGEGGGEEAGRNRGSRIKRRGKEFKELKEWRGGKRKRKVVKGVLLEVKR